VNSCGLCGWQFLPPTSQPIPAPPGLHLPGAWIRLVPCRALMPHACDCDALFFCSDAGSHAEGGEGSGRLGPCRGEQIWWFSHVMKRRLMLRTLHLLVHPMQHRYHVPLARATSPLPLLPACLPLRSGAPLATSTSRPPPPDSLWMAT
jgi:hypothetical protein